MYDLPDDFDPEQFLRRHLEQVSFTVNTVHLDFDGDASITIFGAFEENSVQGAKPVEHAPPIAQSGLMGLLGRQVVSAKKTGPGTIKFLFEGGGEIVCLSDAPEYEAYTIRLGGREIVV